MIKYWLFKWYGWIAIVSALAALVWAASDGKNSLQILSGVGATILGFCYFTQQQKLAETELFHRLFSDFNARYDRMNGALADLLEEGGSTPSSEERKLIADYFNLCAEEYLFFREGYIHPQVWAAWCRGMLSYLRKHPFKDVWNTEKQTGSFYGMTIEELQKGADSKF